MLKSLVLGTTALVLGAVVGCSSAPAPDATASSSTSAAIDTNDGVASIHFQNHCPFPIQVGQTAISDGRYPQPPFARLDENQGVDRNVGPDNQLYQGLAYYGYRDGYDPGGGSLTLAEFKLNSDYYHLDWYDVSLVDGYSLPARIDAIGASCAVAKCDQDLLPDCPGGSRVWSSDGQTIGCTKVADANNPGNPTATYFKSRCPDAYSWSGDDGSVRACDAQDYTVTFCP